MKNRLLAGTLVGLVVAVSGAIMTAQEPPGDAVEVASHLYRVVQENDQVRILEVRARAGEKSEMHSHPSYVPIAITDSQMKFTLPDGRSLEVELEAGQARYSDPLVHATEIAGDSEAHVLLVELK